MIKILLITFTLITSIYSFELPELEINKNNEAKIILFNSKSILVEEKPSYEIKWITENSTDVQLTYIGKVKASSSIVITEDEYNRGPITLTASNDSSTDSKTINMRKKDSDAPVVIYKNRDSEVQTRHYYNTRPYYYPRRYNRRPYRRY